MNLPFFIAKRYGDISLFSIVYKLGIIIVIATLILILSVFNEYSIMDIVESICSKVGLSSFFSINHFRYSLAFFLLSIEVFSLVSLMLLLYIIIFFEIKKIIEKGYVRLLSIVSQFGIAVGTAALILILSVFNGFEDLVLNMYNVFDPHLKVTSHEGKNFDQDKCLEIITTQNGINVISSVLEEKVLLEYDTRQYIATIKGVDQNYNRLINFDSILVTGNYITGYPDDQVAVVGRGIAYYLSMNIGSVFDKLTVYLPNREANNLLKIDGAFKRSSLLPVGVFGVQQEIDSKYIVTPITFVQNLINKSNTVSAFEIKLDDTADMFKIQRSLSNKLGKNYIVTNRFEQQAFLYKILSTEKLVVFLILLFIIIISSFNIIGSLTILIIDKKNDIRSLVNLGLRNNELKNIFFYKSMLGVFSGSLIGLLIGSFIAFLQQKFGFITMGEGSFVIDSYPVIILFKDIVTVELVVILIGLLASWLPSRIIINKYLST
jgi:lipoprotein-releasing system permease protein|tara:strand:+ start:22876 stop:24345 length:1470 start_codon:yes stop_codon:yes gene_type:complete